jgi:erythromycin esterase-like protein
MWRNTEVVGFVEWLWAHNDALSANTEMAGFYGLDLYSLHVSMKAVLQYLERVDLDAAKRAKARYACFDYFGPDPRLYGFIAATDLAKNRAGKR